MQPPRRQNNQSNRMMPRGKSRHGGRNNNQSRSGGQSGQNRGRININQVTNQRDKFQNQARDAQHSGDRVLMEYYLQHADHYQRLINEFNEEQESRRPQQNDPQGGEFAVDGVEQNSSKEEQTTSSPLAAEGLPLPPVIPQDRDDMEPRD